jgi:hypothetical protein
MSINVVLLHHLPCSTNIIKSKYTRAGEDLTDNYELSTTPGLTKMEFDQRGFQEVTRHRHPHQATTQVHTMTATSPTMYAASAKSAGENEAYLHHQGTSATGLHRVQSPTRATAATSPTKNDAGATMTEGHATTDSKKRAAPSTDAGSNAKRPRIDDDKESPCGLVPKKVNNEQWDTMFDRLAVYKLENGDCLVPKRYAQDPKLGTWVETQVCSKDISLLKTYPSFSLDRMYFIV